MNGKVVPVPRDQTIKTYVYAGSENKVPRFLLSALHSIIFTLRPLYHSLNTASTWLFISPSRISELDCATTKTDTAEKSISIGRESLQLFFVLGALAYFQVPPLGGSREEKWRSQ